MSDIMYNFFHITKTAGMSLTKILTGYFSKVYLYENVVYFPRREYTRRCPLVRSAHTDEGKYFVGHLVYYGMHEDINRPAKYIVFLRDPVKRMISLFHHDNIEYIRKDMLFGNFESWMKKNMDKTIIHGLTNGSKILPTLDGAMTILENMTFIGMQETFREDAERLFFEDILIPSENVTADRSNFYKVPLTPLSDSDMELLRSVVVDDIELYKYALRLREGGYRNFRLPIFGV